MRVLSSVLVVCALSLSAAAGDVPVLYCTDLFHPHDDPDDHFDVATLYALQGVEIRGIVLDQGMSGEQAQRPGTIPVGQMNALTGRKVPVAAGLWPALTSPEDKGLDRGPEWQGGVELILKTLRESPEPVVVLSVGSARDIVAAFNREPELCREKIRRIGAFIGDASSPDFVEYNVMIDPHAYVGLMRSGLPVYWVPCFDGGIWQNKGHASFWQANHGDLLRAAPPEVVQFFIYALEKETADPLAFLRQPVDPARRDKLFAETRNLWCTAVFAALCGQSIVKTDAGYAVRPGGDAATVPANELFTFTPVRVSVTGDRFVQYGEGGGAQEVMRFDVRNAGAYAQGMTSATAGVLAAFPVRAAL
jgi:hypothetical protein